MATQLAEIGVSLQVAYSTISFWSFFFIQESKLFLESHSISSMGFPGEQGLGRWEESQSVTSVDRGENGGRAQIWLVAFTEGVMWGGHVFSLERGR